MAIIAERRIDPDENWPTSATLAPRPAATKGNRAMGAAHVVVETNIARHSSPMSKTADRPWTVRVVPMGALTRFSFTRESKLLTVMASRFSVAPSVSNT
jgi:hypothetical protein